MDAFDWKTNIEKENRLPPANWDALKAYAVDLKRTQSADPTCPIACELSPKYNMGGSHLFRLLIFDDDTKWIARIQKRECNAESISILLHEVHTLALLRERTRIPVPQVIGYESSRSNPVGVAFMIMEAIPGITAMDLCRGSQLQYSSNVPQEYKAKFYRALAEIQVEMTSVRFPKIGMIIKREDGTYDTGPIPGLGGPFETATDYLVAWANHAKFPNKLSDHRGPVFPIPLEIEQFITPSIEQFPQKLKGVLSKIVRMDTGPFPLYHKNFTVTKVIVDKECNILSVIDWENACVVPWEILEMPEFMLPLSPQMNQQWEYDPNARPKDPEYQQLWEEQEDYVKMIQDSEKRQQADDKLSTIFAQREIRNLANAIKLYLNPGKWGFYCNVLHCFGVDPKVWEGSDKP